MLRLACSSIPDLVCQAAADGLSSADRARARQSEEDLEGRKEGLAQALFDHIPVGVGSQGIIPTTAADLEAALEMGMDWSLREVGPGLGRGPTPPLPCGPQQRCLRVMTVGHVANRAGRAQAPHADLGPRPSGAAARGGRPAPVGSAVMPLDVLHTRGPAGRSSAARAEVPPGARAGGAAPRSIGALRQRAHALGPRLQGGAVRGRRGAARRGWQW